MNPLSKTPTRVAGLALLLGSLPIGLWAQRTQAPAASTDDAVVLSPFVVNEGAEDGYYSPQAVSGTRTRTELINLPLNITVFNENFINDIGARDLVDIVSFASGVSGGATSASDTSNGDTLGFVLRGQGGFLPNRNGFRRLRLVDPVTISRVEILKGPSSVLYGQASPGGSVNYITKRPVQRKILSTAVQVGSYEHYKAWVDVNVPSENRAVAARFVGSYQNSESWIDRFHTEQTVLYPSFTWWIRPTTTLTVEYEQTKAVRDPQSPLPFHNTIDSDTWHKFTDVDYDWNMRGPSDFFNTSIDVLTAEFTHRFNDYLTLRSSFSDAKWEDDSRINSPAIAVGSTNPPTMQGRAYSRVKRGSEDNYLQVELLNNFTWGGIEVQNLVGYQRGEEDFRMYYQEIAPPRNDTALWDLTDRSTWRLTEYIVGEGTHQVTGSNARNRLDSGYVVNQLTMLDGRLHTLAGARVDKIKSDGVWNASGPNPSPSSAEYPSKISPQYGLLYKLTEDVSVFANWSTSIVNLYTTRARRPDGSYFNPVPGTGTGYDFGIKADTFQDKLSGSLSFYELQEEDIMRQLARVTLPDGDSFVPAEQSGVNLSRGIELDLSYRPTPRTQVGLGYAYTDAIVESDVQASVEINGVRYLTREGHQLAYSPKHQIAVNLRQDLGAMGLFNSTYLLANARWVDDRQHTETWFVDNGQLRAPWLIDSYSVVNLGAGGSFELMGAKMNASLMVKNVLDERYLANRHYYGAPRTVEFTLRANF